MAARRADRVKNYLVENGVPAADVETQAIGKEKNLTSQEVIGLLNQNPNLTPEERKRVRRNLAVFRMANNRRVDVRLTATGQTSHRYFPYNSDDLKLKRVSWVEGYLLIWVKNQGHPNCSTALPNI